MRIRLGRLPCAATTTAASATRIPQAMHQKVAHRISLLVLDCDGIIFDSNKLKTAAYRQTLAAFTAPIVYVVCRSVRLVRFVFLNLYMQWRRPTYFTY